MRAPAIVASVLGADYARLGQEVAEAGCDTVLVHAEASGLIARSGLQTLIEVDGGMAELRRSLQSDVEALRE
jgi:pentose-5-phosphate-3-epimerase